MTISNLNDRDDYVGNSSTDTYSYTFKIFSSSNLLVTQRDLNNVEATMALGVDYTVTGVGDKNGGSIVLTAGNLATGYLLAIRRVRPLIQDADIRNQGAFFPETHEDVFDKLVMVQQQQANDIARSMRLPETGTGVNIQLPIPEALKFFRWNAAATALENITAGSVTLAIPASESVDADKLDSTDIVAMRAKLSVSSTADVLLKAGGTMTGKIVLDGDATAALNPVPVQQIQRNNLIYAVDTGTTDAYIGVYSPAITAYTVGMRVVLKIVNANLTVTPVVKFNALANKTIKRIGGSVLPGDLQPGLFAELLYDGTDFILLNPSLHSHANANQGGVLTGRVLQTVYSSYLLSQSTAAVIPYDDTPPQITEGAEFFTGTITPKASGNTLTINGVVNASVSANVYIIFALFRDSVATALQVAVAPLPGISISEQASTTIPFSYSMLTTSTTPITFRIRGGPDGAGTVYVNGDATSRRFGGVWGSNMTIVETQGA